MTIFGPLLGARLPVAIGGKQSSDLPFINGSGRANSRHSNAPYQADIDERYELCPFLGQAACFGSKTIRREIACRHGT